MVSGENLWRFWSGGYWRWCYEHQTSDDGNQFMSGIAERLPSQMSVVAAIGFSQRTDNRVDASGVFVVEFCDAGSDAVEFCH